MKYPVLAALAVAVASLHAADAPKAAAGMLPRKDENAMRSEAVLRGVYMASTMNAARAAVLGIRSLREHPLTVSSLQEHAKVLPAKA